MEQINKLLMEERQKSTEVVTRYGEVAKENEVLKAKLAHMGDDMSKLKASVAQAFTEEESTKKNIKELVTAMQSQLVAAQQRILEKEKENGELLDILQKVKDLQYLEKFMPNGKGRGQPQDEDDEEEGEMAAEEQEGEPNDNLYESMAAIRSLQPGRDSLNADSIGYGMTSDKRTTREEEGEFDSEYSPPMITKQKKTKKIKAKPSKASQEQEKNINQHAETKHKADTAKPKQANGRISSNKQPQDTQESQTQLSKSTASVQHIKHATAAQALNTIKKSKETIEKIQSQGEPKKKLSKSKEPIPDKLSAHEKNEMLSKMGMISEMASVLKSFESKIKQMQADMSRLAAK